MIGPGTGVRVYLACGATDMRKGITGLAALAQDVLRQKPASGAVFAFRGRMANRQSFRIQNPRSADRISVASTFWPRPAGSRRRP